MDTSRDSMAGRKRRGLQTGWKCILIVRYAVAMLGRKVVTLETEKDCKDIVEAEEILSGGGVSNEAEERYCRLVGRRRRCEGED